MIPAAQDPSEPTDAGLLALKGGRRASGPLCVRSTERSAKSEGTPGLEPTLVKEEPVEADVLYTGEAADMHMQVEEEDSDEGSLSYGGRNDDSLCDADGRKTYSFSSTSKDRSEISMVKADLLPINGSVDDPREEPPLPVGFENRRVVHLAAKRLGGPGGPRCVVGFGVSVGGVLIGKPVVKIKAGRPESAIVREMISMILLTSSEVVFAMSDARLMKTLLQPHRRFRSPLLYPLVSELHERSRAAGIDVTLIGGIAQPRGLGRALHNAIRAEAARSASGGLTPAMTSDHVL